MKIFKQYFFTPLCFLVFVFALGSCDTSSDEPGSWKDEAIKASKREEFHKLNDDLFAAFKANKPEDVKNMMSKELLEGDPIDRTIELCSIYSKAGGYKLLDEYYINDKTEPGKLLINADATGADAYTLKYNQSTTKENYIAFLIVKSGADNWLITAVYGKYNYGWKLNKLDVGQYAINGKSAPELYKQAKEKYAKGYWIDAVNDMAAAEKCFRPSGQWQYAKENQMSNFFFTVVQQVNEKYTFPFTISQVATKPKIFRILTETRPEGTFPMIYYLSSVNIQDTLGLQKENKQVQKVIGKVLPGIDKDKKFVLYSAFNGLPGGHKTLQHYDLTEKL